MLVAVDESSDERMSDEVSAQRFTRKLTVLVTPELYEQLAELARAQLLTPGTKARLLLAEAVAREIAKRRR